MSEFWGMDSDTTDHTINVHINRLRSKFEIYKDEMRLLVEDTEDVKVFEIENNDLRKTVDTIKDIILDKMVGE